MDKYKDMIELLRKTAEVKRSLEKEGTFEVLMQAADAIEELLQVQDQMGDDIAMMNEELLKHEWIPVSDRLPESSPDDLEYPTVLGSFSDGSVQLVCYYESTKEWGGGEYFDMKRFPVAWMPLPKPYEGGKE